MISIRFRRRLLKMRKVFAGYSLLLCFSAVAFGQSDEGDFLRVEYRRDPIGIDTPSPRFSWSQAKGGQKSYRIIVASSSAILAQGVGDVWDSGEVVSTKSVGVEYAGRPLRTGERVWWKVLSKGVSESKWSGVARFCMGVMKPEDWTAKWIAGNPVTRPLLDVLPAEWIGQRVRGRILLQKTFVWTGVGDGTDDFAFVTTEPADVCVNGRPVLHLTGHVFDCKALRFCHLAPFLMVGTNDLAVVFADENHGRKPTARVSASARAAWGVIRLGDGRVLCTDSSWGGESFGQAHQPDWSCRVDFREEVCAPAFERIFKVEKPVCRATAFVTGVGYYELSLDGTKVGTKVLDPSPTDYTKRILYSTYELEDLLRPGEHRFSLVVGHGWYDMLATATWNWDAAPWRSFPRAIFQLELEYADGSHDCLVSDDRWRQVKSSVSYDSPREGEVVGGSDRRAPDLEKCEIFASVVDGPVGRLTAEAQPGSEVVETIRPTRIAPLGENAYVLEFPQNLAGWVRFVATGLRAGETISVRYDERNPLDETNRVIRSIGQHLCATASHRLVPCAPMGFQTDHLVGGGTGTDIYEPRFKYHGFAYVTLMGVRNPDWLLTAEARWVQTAFERTGTFDCSDTNLNALVRAAERSYRCNFTNGFPTDCPHREQNGWTGDASIASEFAQYAFENTAGYEKWLRDIADAQAASGDIPCIVPTSGWGFAWGNGPAWDSALPVIAWDLWRMRGDRRIVEEIYPVLIRLNYYTATRAQNGLVRHGLGDWCPRDKGHVPALEYTSSCYYLQALATAGAMARILDRPSEATGWCRRAMSVRQALRAKYRRPCGVWDNGSLTAQAMALTFGLCEDEDECRQTAARLLTACEDAEYAPDFGILGSKHLFRALGEIGHFDEAIRILLCPGDRTFSKWVHDGKGTLWEHFSGNSSLNHVMFCDFAACLYQYAGGIRIPGGLAAAVPKAGYEPDVDFLIAPQFVSALDWVNASVLTPVGRLTSCWRRKGEEVELKISVPEGLKAEVRLPFGEMRRVLGGEHVYRTKSVQRAMMNDVGSRDGIMVRQAKLG